MGQHVQNQELILVKLNQMKKENPEQRKLQNKRYREKNRVMLILKKQLAYQKKKHNLLRNSLVNHRNSQILSR
jgi:hypothetical protein